MHYRQLELKIPPLAVLVIFAAFAFGLSKIAAAGAYQFQGAVVLASLLALLGIGSAVAGVLAFRRQQTTVNPMAPGEASSVVSSGIFGLTRNPMYLGMVLVLLAWTLFLRNAAALLAVPAFVAYMTQFQIKAEERALRENFGREYVKYLQAVRRWI